MPQSLAAVFIHLVYATKNRQPFLADPDLRAEMHAYLGGASKTLGCPPIRVGGVEDHVHILAVLSRSLEIGEWVKEQKRVSSVWIKERDPRLADFAWQAGYGAFSVSMSNVDAVEDYIVRQEEHHRRRTFQDEFRGLLAKHRLEWDERYVWD